MEISLNDKKQDNETEANTSSTNTEEHIPEHMHNFITSTKELSKYFTNEFHQINQIKRYNRPEGKNKTYVEHLKVIQNKKVLS